MEGIEKFSKEENVQMKQYAQFLKKADKNKTLRQLSHLTDIAYQNIDCLSCAACCKNYSPRFKTPDIKRISKLLKLKESSFIHQYLKIDEDGDYVLQQKSCPFLDPKNYCTIYADRPSDCKRFPYTDEDVLLKRPAITLKNASFCGIVKMVLEKLMEEKNSKI